LLIANESFDETISIPVLTQGRDFLWGTARAVGGAVGHNPISIIIPCHRVVGTDGSLTGYAGGLDRKIKLLELEGAKRTCLFVPKKGTALQAEENFRSYCCRKPEKSRF